MPIVSTALPFCHQFPQRTTQALEVLQVLKPVGVSLSLVAVTRRGAQEAGVHRG
jgi:hypothetical protein